MNWQAAKVSTSTSRSADIAIGNRTVVFAGHGAFNEVSDAPPNDTFVVPAGMTIVFWCMHGNPFAGSELDKRLHSGDFSPQKFNAKSPKQQALAEAGVTPASFQLGAHRMLPEIFQAGTRCPQYRLTPPTGLVLANRSGDTRFITVPDRGPQNIGYRLEDLLTTHAQVCQNATIHWAACRAVKQR